ncbi:hypothetical protein [Anaerolinea thermophila]|uniref:hypothetical protein n=1 Tax=Anaerolinea thermophila TaxID=167964 RepID=UPI0012DE07C1|nr:hypothetical protein [Anaerolinea thermophila]
MKEETINHEPAGSKVSQKKSRTKSFQAGRFWRLSGFWLLVILCVILSLAYIGKTGEKGSEWLLPIMLGWMAGLGGNIVERDPGEGMLKAGMAQTTFLLAWVIPRGLPSETVLFALVWLFHTVTTMLAVYLEVARVRAQRQLKTTRRK